MNKTVGAPWGMNTTNVCKNKSSKHKSSSKHKRGTQKVNGNRKTTKTYISMIRVIV